jgi:hypothetical protein
MAIPQRCIQCGMLICDTSLHSIPEHFDFVIANPIMPYTRPAEDVYWNRIPSETVAD